MRGRWYSWVVCLLIAGCYLSSDDPPPSNRAERREGDCRGHANCDRLPPRADVTSPPQSCTPGQQSVPGMFQDPCAQNTVTCPSTFGVSVAACDGRGTWGRCQCLSTLPPQGGSGGNGAGGAAAGRSGATGLPCGSAVCPNPTIDFPFNVPVPTVCCADPARGQCGMKQPGDAVCVAPPPSHPDCAASVRSAPGIPATLLSGCCTAVGTCGVWIGIEMCIQDPSVVTPSPCSANGGDLDAGI